MKSEKSIVRIPPSSASITEANLPIIRPEGRTLHLRREGTHDHPGVATTHGKETNGLITTRIGSTSPIIGATREHEPANLRGSGSAVRSTIDPRDLSEAVSEPVPAGATICEEDVASAAGSKKPRKRAKGPKRHARSYRSLF